MINPPDQAGRGTGSEKEDEEWTGCGSGGKALQAEDSGCELARPEFIGANWGGGGGSAERSWVGGRPGTPGTRSRRAFPV